MKKFKIMAFLLAGVLAITPSLVFASDIYSNASGDFRKVTRIEARETSYSLEVDKAYDFSKNIKVFETEDKLVTDQNYIDYSITGSTADFKINGSVVIALRADKTATIIITDTYSNKVKTEIKVKSVANKGTQMATGIQMNTRTNVIYNSNTGKNNAGFALAVNAVPDGALFTNKDKQTVSDSLAEQIADILGVSNFGSVENQNASYKVGFSTIGGEVGKLAEFEVDIIADVTATVGATETVFTLDIDGTQVVSNPVNCTTKKTAKDIAIAFDGKKIELNAVSYTLTARGSRIFFKSDVKADIAIAAISNLPVTVAQSDAGTAITWTTEQNLAANVKTYGVDSGVAANDGFVLPTNTAPYFEVDGVKVIGKTSLSDVVFAKDLIVLFDEVEFRAGNVQWVCVEADGVILITPKAIAINYDSMSEADKKVNNSINNIRAIAMPEKITANIVGVKNNIVSVSLKDIVHPVKTPTNVVSVRFLNEGTEHEDKSVIELVVDDTQYFTEDAKAVSYFNSNATKKIETGNITLEYGKTRATKAYTNLNAVNAIEAKAVYFPNDFSVVVGERKEITPTFIPSGANVIGDIEINASSNENAVIQKEGNKYFVYGINSTNNATTNFEVIMTTGLYGVDRSNFTVSVKKAEFKKTETPKLNTVKAEIKENDKIVITALNAQGKVKWEKDGNGKIIEVAVKSDNSCTVIAKITGTTKLTAVLENGDKLVCDITVVKNPTLSGGSDVPQTGDSWISNIFMNLFGK